MTFELPALDGAAAKRAAAAFDRKTKPLGSLGRLEETVCRIAAVRGSLPSARLRAAAVVVAADHGVAAEGVSAYPQEVTRQMVANFVAGGAAAAVLARRAGIPLIVVDAGLVAPFHDEAVLSFGVAASANFVTEPALTSGQAELLVREGRALATRLAGDGVELLALGEMGIGNTTVASVLSAALLDEPPATVCGRGTGIDDNTLRRKVDTVERALARHGVSREPLSLLASLGGGEIAFLTGLMIGAAENRLVCVIDGVVVGAAALVASALAPGLPDWLLAGHRSPEPAHDLILQRLGLLPLLDLGMRLGEASGALVALSVIDAATALLAEMATFESAGVSDRG
ncbi:MAG: nicotinate-nucleotide--dimethylbenzimidazole phosphoribosyltransferase [Gaiellaceae bacterium]